MARSTISPWPGRARCTFPRALSWRKAFRWPISSASRARMGEAAREAGVKIVTGDTKVVERGKADGVFITTAGIGVVPPGLNLSGDRARPGDAILVSGSHRRPRRRHHVVPRESAIRDADSFRYCGAARSGRGDGRGLRAILRLMRDPTRGGLAATLNEIAHQSGRRHPHRGGRAAGQAQVAAACELLGLDPLFVANEGKLVALSDRSRAKNFSPRCAPMSLAATPRSSAMSSRTNSISCRWPQASAATASSTGCQANNCRGFAERAGAIYHCGDAAPFLWGAKMLIFKK